MSKHTPGPWAIAYLSCNALKIIDGHRGLAVADMIPPCMQSAARDMATTQANARLIAESPNLLENLERITNSANDLLNEIVSSPDGKGNWGGLAAHIQLAREAIAKAKGE